ncbi:alpha/beta hydrolase [Methylopila sp. M107]|uniref:alpha/beta hydrolase n=1 Tax=Methylopila sp. M107 TaxID=1101190 RepID=UPI0003A9810C|nr:alpha/beta hydrolase [Methylopila sp. M107]
MSIVQAARRAGGLSRSAAAVLAVAVLAFVAVATGFAGPARAAVADDPTGAGPYTAVSGDYKLAPSFDALVTKLVARKTELWARVWYPTKGPALANAPIVVFLHGEHGTCGKVDPTGKWRLDGSALYSSDGVCTGEYPLITPNHLGYDYIAQRLATQGYVTISINTNLGINQTGFHISDPDPSLIIRRGRMILRHLMQFGRWNGGLDTTTRPSFFSNFQGKLDFSKISLVGHSRGGDAIVNAYFQLVGNTDGWQSRLPANAKIVALAAIAPTDKAAQKNVPSQIPMDGAGYGVLLPMCDGDVYRLEGMRFYDRAVGFFPDDQGNFRAAFAVEGASHNGFNTEWHTQDNYSLGGANKPTLQTCLGQPDKLFKEIGTSIKQQDIARQFVMSIVRAKTKGGSWAELLNPAYELPKPISELTLYDRSYFPATDIGANRLLARFSAVPSGNCANILFGYAGVTTRCTNLPEHFFNYGDHADKYNVWAARILWGPPANKTKPKDKLFWAFVTIANGSTPQDISKMKAIEMRIGPDCKLYSAPDSDKDGVPEYACSDRTEQSLLERGSQHIGVQFIDSAGKLSNRKFVLLKDYIDERQVVGIDQDATDGPIKPLYHGLMSTVRLPVSAFTKEADKGFNLSKIVGMYLLLSPKSGDKGNKTGGLVIGDIWATQNLPASMKFDAAGDASAPLASGDRDDGPLLRAPSLDGFEPAFSEIRSGFADASIQPAAAIAPGPADAGARIVDAVRRPSTADLGSGVQATSGLIELTVATRTNMIENSNGFRVVIGGRSAGGVTIDRGASANPREITIAVPAAFVDDAPDGAPLAITSGGSTWRFGSLSKSAVR